MTLSNQVAAVALASIVSCSMGCGQGTLVYGESDGSTGWGIELYFSGVSKDMSLATANDIEHALKLGLNNFGKNWSDDEIRGVMSGTPAIWRPGIWECDYLGNSSKCDGENYGDYIVVADMPGCQRHGAYAHEILHSLKQSFEGDSDHDHSSPEWGLVSGEWMGQCE